MFTNLTKGTEKQMSYARDIIADMEKTRTESIKQLEKNSPQHIAQFEKINDLQDAYYNDFYENAGDVINDYKEILTVYTLAEKRKIMREKVENYCKNAEGGKEWMKEKTSK